MNGIHGQQRKRQRRTQASRQFSRADQCLERAQRVPADDAPSIVLEPQGSQFRSAE
jgi:hypothetical protein